MNRVFVVPGTNACLSRVDVVLFRVGVTSVNDSQFLYFNMNILRILNSCSSRCYDLRRGNMSFIKPITDCTNGFGQVGAHLFLFKFWWQSKGFLQGFPKFGPVGSAGGPLEDPLVNWFNHRGSPLLLFYKLESRIIGLERYWLKFSDIFILRLPDTGNWSKMSTFYVLNNVTLNWISSGQNNCNECKETSNGTTVVMWLQFVRPGRC